MAVLAFTDASVVINSVDLSNDCTSLGLELSADELVDTAFGDTFQSRIGGLKDTSWSLEFNQDFAASQVDVTLAAIVGSNVTVVAKPTSAAVGATNPTYTQSVLISKYSPFGNKVGELATVSVQWPGAGTCTRATA